LATVKNSTAALIRYAKNAIRSTSLCWGLARYRYRDWRCTNLLWHQYRGDLDCGIYGLWGSIRLYWTLFGRDHHFFTGKEDERAKQPRLRIDGVDSHSGRIRVAVVNSGGSIARGCYGKITIEHTREDVIDGTDFGIHTRITPTEFMQVDRSDVCWARGGNPARIAIPRGENVPEMLEVAWLRELAFAGPFIPAHPTGSVLAFYIPSEGSEGAGGAWYIGRVLLKPKTYNGELFVGTNDLEPITKKFALVYNERDRTAYLELRAS